MKQFSIIILLLCSLPVMQAQIYTDYLGAGHKQGVSVTTSSQSTDTEGIHTIDGFGLLPDLPASARLLMQSTFGTNKDEILNVQNIGAHSWLENEFEKPMTSYKQQVIDNVVLQKNLSDQYYGTTDQSILNSLARVSKEDFSKAWWQIAMTHDDHLRQRIAFCLSQFFVVSSINTIFIAYGTALGNYYDILYHNAFGNYRDLLHQVALSPVMGHYLSHLNNAKADPSLNTLPDENFAREIMQLFSIGLYELNMNGTRKTDSNGNFIPTYNNNDIKEFAKVFTGLGGSRWGDTCQELYGFEGDSLTCVLYFPEDLEVQFNSGFNAIDRESPMKMFQEYHETSSKTLLNGFVLPANQDGMLDIEMTIDHLFNHPSTPPFFCKRLIQFLVKSNPTPQYIERVANVFVDDGNGLRGDMKAIIKAIILDPEARDCEWIDHYSSGKLLEPIHRRIHMLKALNMNNAAEHYWYTGFQEEDDLQQAPLSSPTVFNFYSPFHSPSGEIRNSGSVAPEFKLHNSVTSIRFVNFIEGNTYTPAYDLGRPFDGIYIPPDDELNISGLREWYDQNFTDGFDLSYDISDLLDLANTPDALLDELNILLARGALSTASIDAIKTMIVPLSESPDYTNETVVYMAIYFIMISPDYAILK